MFWLRVLVIFLAVLIVLALGLIGYGFYNKSSDPEWKLFGADARPSPGAAPGAATPSPTKPFADFDLGLPPGCMILRVDSGNALTYLTIGPDESCNRVIVLDLRSGLRLGTIKARP